MTTNRQPTGDELNGVKQDTVQWPAKAHRVTTVDSDGNEITVTNPLPVMPVDGSSQGTGLEGLGKVTVGTTAVELAFSGTTESIIISSWINNTGIIYVGKSNVANDGSNAIAFLDVGESLTLDYDDATNAIYVVSDTASQTVVVGATE